MDPGTTLSPEVGTAPCHSGTIACPPYAPSADGAPSSPALWRETWNPKVETPKELGILSGDLHRVARCEVSPQTRTEDGWRVVPLALCVCVVSSRRCAHRAAPAAVLSRVLPLLHGIKKWSQRARSSLPSAGGQMCSLTHSCTRSVLLPRAPHALGLQPGWTLVPRR
jgi:hypothetical protein